MSKRSKAWSKPKSKHVGTVYNSGEPKTEPTLENDWVNARGIVQAAGQTRSQNEGPVKDQTIGPVEAKPMAKPKDEAKDQKTKLMAKPKTKSKAKPKAKPKAKSKAKSKAKRGQTKDPDKGQDRVHINDRAQANPSTAELLHTSRVHASSRAED